jgi:hypothetical protein
VRRDQRAIHFEYITCSSKAEGCSTAAYVLLVFPVALDVLGLLTQCWAAPRALSFRTVWEKSRFAIKVRVSK